MLHIKRRKYFSLLCLFPSFVSSSFLFLSPKTTRDNIKQFSILWRLLFLLANLNLFSYIIFIYKANQGAIKIRQTILISFTASSPDQDIPITFNISLCGHYWVRTESLNKCQVDSEFRCHGFWQEQGYLEGDINLFCLNSRITYNCPFYGLILTTISLHIFPCCWFSPTYFKNRSLKLCMYI